MKLTRFFRILEVVKFLQYFLPDPQKLRLESWQMKASEYHLWAVVTSTQMTAQCPGCRQFSQRVHSRYQRTLEDLSLAQYRLTLQVKVRKFFCLNSTCLRRIFTERLPEVAAPWARKTMRLVQQLQQISLALGGAAGSQLVKQLGYRASGSSLLNYLKRLPLPPIEVPKHLGVDDFAFRRGRQYGTILVDLEQHRPIALLADRKAETVAEWLQQHPGVEVLSRDRSKLYRSGMNQGAPNAVQVADRFHLVQNLTETLEKVFRSYHAELKVIEQQHRPATTAPEVAVVRAKPTATAAEQAQFQAKHQRRIDQQQQIKQLTEQCWTQTAIAQAVGVSERTVQRYVKLPDFPAIQPRRKAFGKSVLDPYKARFLEWWNDGMRQPRLLMSLLQQQGYEGSLRTVTRYISSLRAAQGLPAQVGCSPQSSVKVCDPQSSPLTARRASYLVVTRQENRDSEEQALIEKLIAQHPDLAVAIEIADEFLHLVRQRQGEAFDAWVSKALKSSLKPFQAFAEGLLDDYDAVKASMTLNISNGAVEGLNNRLKLLKRQMYGRAGLALLNKRFVLAA